MNKLDGSGRDHVIVMNDKRLSRLVYFNKRYTMADCVSVCKSLNRKSKRGKDYRKFYYQDVKNLCPNTIGLFEEKTR